MDLSKIPTEDLQAIQNKQWDKVSTAGLQEYQSQRQHLVQASQQAQNPQQIPDSADKAAQGGKPDAQAVSNQPDSPLMGYLKKGVSAISSFHGGLLKGASLGNIDPSKAFGVDTTGGAMEESPTAASLGKFAGGAASAAGLAALGGGPAASALGRVAQNTGIGAALGGLSKPSEGENRSENALIGGAVGGVLSAGLEGVSSISGKLGDYLMQKGVGMRKYQPGVGTSLADQGIWGTRNMAENQVERKLPEAEEAVQQAVKGISGNVDAQPIGDAIAKQGNKFNLPSTGEPGPGMAQYADKVKQAASEFQSMGEGGELSPSDLLSIKRQGDWLGYSASGNPATSLESDLGRAQADKSRELLNSLSGGETSETLAKERALILAKKALEKPETIHQGMGSSLFFGKYPGQSVIGTSLGHAGVKGGQASGALADPRILESLFSGVKQGNN